MSETFLIIRRIQHDNIINVQYSTYIGLQVQCRYYCQIVMKVEFHRQFFEKYSNAKFHDNTSSGSGVVQCGQTDGQT